MSLKDLKTGTIIEFEGNPYEVLESEHAKLGRGGAFVRVKIKNLITGETIRTTFRREEDFEFVNVESLKAQFLYKDDKNFYFMDQQTFDQITLDADVVGEKAQFLKEGLEVEIIFYKKKAISVKLPPVVLLKIIQADPGIKGNRESPGTKSAVLETGATIQVPLFIKEGDVVKINTETGQYLQREE